MMTEKLLTVKELAQKLRLAPKTIYKLTSVGSIPVLRMGRSLRFDPQAVERSMQERQNA